MYLKFVFINLGSPGLQDLYNIVISVSVSLKILIKLLESLAFKVLNISKAIVRLKVVKLLKLNF